MRHHSDLDIRIREHGYDTDQLVDSLPPCPQCNGKQALLDIAPDGKSITIRCALAPCPRFTHDQMLLAGMAFTVSEREVRALEAALRLIKKHYDPKLPNLSAKEWGAFLACEDVDALCERLASHRTALRQARERDSLLAGERATRQF